VTAIPYSLIRAAFWLACLGVAILSLLPGEAIPSVFNFWDKAQHSLAFAGLSLLGLWSYLSRRNRVLLGLLLFGAVIEIAQAMTTWRAGDLRDWAADGLGIALGYLIAMSLRVTPRRFCG
jgi:VanZ family protein